MSRRIQKRNIITYGAMRGSGILPKNCVETLFFNLFQGFSWETPLENIFKLNNKIRINDGAIELVENMKANSGNRNVAVLS